MLLAQHRYHLSGTAIAGCLYLPTHSRRPFARNLDGQPNGRDIFGISARKVYPGLLLPAIPVGSYPTFSPSPHAAHDWQLFSVALSVTRLGGYPPVRWCVALCCPDFPSPAKSKER